MKSPHPSHPVEQFVGGQIRIFQRPNGSPFLQVLGDITDVVTEGTRWRIGVKNLRQQTKGAGHHGPWHPLPYNELVLDLSQMGRVGYSRGLGFTKYFQDSPAHLGHGRVALYPADAPYQRSRRH